MSTAQIKVWFNRKILLSSSKKYSIMEINKKWIIERPDNGYVVSVDVKMIEI